MSHKLRSELRIHLNLLRIPKLIWLECLLRKEGNRGNKMPTVNRECQVIEDTLQPEIQEASARKRKLEEALKAAEAASERLIDAGARREIEAHKNRHQSPNTIPSEIQSRSPGGKASR